MPDRDDRGDDVPKLPYGGKLKLSSAQLMRIAITGAMLAIVIIARKPCSDSMGKFVTDFGSGSNAGNAQMPKPGNVDLPLPEKGSAGSYEVLGSNITEAEWNAIKDRARAREAAKAGSGSASGSAGSAAP